MSQKDSIQMCIGAEKKNRQNELFQYIWKRPKWPLQTPLGPPKHPKRSPNDVISLQGSCPKHPREFWKFHFGAVGFRDVRPRKVPGWFHTGAKAFFGVKIFKISKLSGMIDMMSPKKKLNGEGGLLCLWASPGAFKSTISANSSIWPTVSDFELSEVNCQLQGMAQRKNPPKHRPIKGLNPRDETSILKNGRVRRSPHPWFFQLFPMSMDLCWLWTVRGQLSTSR